jgi:cation transporter-like permease
MTDLRAVELAASNAYVDWGSMGKILLISVIAGAGLVAVYALGLVALSMSGFLQRAEGGPDHRIGPLLVCILCGLVVIAAVVFGIHTIFTK